MMMSFLIEFGVVRDINIDGFAPLDVLLLVGFNCWNVESNKTAQIPQIITLLVIAISWHDLYQYLGTWNNEKQMSCF